MNIIRRLQLLFYILINICCLYHWILSQIIKVRNWEPMLVFQTTTIKINWKYSFLEKQLTMMTLAYLNCNNYNQSNWRFLLLESSSIRISFLLKKLFLPFFPIDSTCLTMLVFSWKTSFAVADYNLFFFACSIETMLFVKKKERKRKKLRLNDNAYKNELLPLLLLFR